MSQPAGAGGQDTSPAGKCGARFGVVPIDMSPRRWGASPATQRWAVGPFPCSELVRLPYKAMGLGSTKWGCRGYPKLGGCQSSSFSTQSPSLGERRAMGPVLHSWVRTDGQTDHPAGLSSANLGHVDSLKSSSPLPPWKVMVPFCKFHSLRVLEK